MTTNPYADIRAQSDRLDRLFPQADTPLSRLLGHAERQAAPYARPILYYACHEQIPPDQIVVVEAAPGMDVPGFLALHPDGLPALVAGLALFDLRPLQDRSEH